MPKRLSKTQKETLVFTIFDLKLLNFGEFEFVSGITSPMYMNLRNLLSYPKFLRYVAECYGQLSEDIVFDQLGAVPYGALAATSALSLQLEKPWLCVRKEPKKHGMGKNIIGDFKKGERVLVIDDVVTTGGSKVESAKLFEKEGLIVEDFLVIFDYEKGAPKLLGKQGYKLHSMLTIKEAITILANARKISSETQNNVFSFLEK